MGCQDAILSMEERGCSRWGSVIERQKSDFSPSLCLSTMLHRCFFGASPTALWWSRLAPGVFGGNLRALNCARLLRKRSTPVYRCTTWCVAGVLGRDSQWDHLLACLRRTGGRHCSTRHTSGGGECVTYSSVTCRSMMSEMHVPPGGPEWTPLAATPGASSEQSPRHSRA